MGTGSTLRAYVGVSYRAFGDGPLECAQRTTTSWVLIDHAPSLPAPIRPQSLEAFRKARTFYADMPGRPLAEVLPTHRTAVAYRPSPAFPDHPRFVVWYTIR